MKRATTLVDRLLSLVLGVTLLAAGALTFGWYYRVPLASDVLSRFDRDEFVALPAQSWWNIALAMAAVTSTVVALGLLVGNLTSGRTETLLVSSGESLAVRVELDALAKGVAAELARFPGVEKSRGRAIHDRGTATLDIAVRASPHLDIDAFTRLAELRAAFVADAVGGCPVALRVQLHL